MFYASIFLFFHSFNMAEHSSNEYDHYQPHLWFFVLFAIGRLSAVLPKSLKTSTPDHVFIGNIYINGPLLAKFSNLSKAYFQGFAQFGKTYF